MKIKETIIKLIGSGTQSINDSPYSIMQNANLEKMGFNVVEIGAPNAGFDWSDLQSIPEYIKNQDHINILIDAHGNVIENYFIITINNQTKPSGFVLLDTISNIINYTNKDIKINFILDSCHGAAIHSDIAKRMINSLPEGSKVITLSDANSPTVMSDLYSRRIDSLLKANVGNDLQFIDLVKLYCISKRSSENTPVIGLQTKDGYKTVSFEEITQDLLKKSQGDIKFSNFLENIFDQNILSKEVMKKIIEKSKNTSDYSNLKMINIGDKALDSINSNTKSKFIAQLSKEFYSDQSLDFLTFSALEDKIKKYTDCDSHGEKSKILAQYPNLENSFMSKEFAAECERRFLELYEKLFLPFDKKTYQELMEFIEGTQSVTGVSWDMFSEDISSAKEKMIVSFKNMKIYSLHNDLINILKNKIDDFKEEASPFALESPCIKEIETDFASFEHDNILSNHGYLMVLGADYAEQYLSEM